jgi:arylsulfatase A-like enzyme
MDGQMLMTDTSQKAVLTEISSEVSTQLARGPKGLRPHQWLVMSVWCGLVAGPIEVGAIVVRKSLVDLNQFYWISRHFVWLIPLTNLGIFLAVGVVLTLLVLCWSRLGIGPAARMLCALALLPPFWAAFPRVYAPAGVILALGVATQLVPALTRHAVGFHRGVRLSFPFLVAVTPLLGASVWFGDRLNEWREEGRPSPSSKFSNVVLIVLDTTAADHLSLNGYSRRTSPTLDGLARRGIRFDRARATSSWTLPSHASFFTGRWPHELSAGWLTPLDATYPTLAEYLRSKGFATAGFVANLFYCGADTGLARGFTDYRDYIFPELSALKMASLIGRPIEGLRAIDDHLSTRIDSTFFRSLISKFDAGRRKPAAVVNRELLNWLSRRDQPGRPFFAFVNYFDVHSPYKPPEGGIHRFGVGPRTEREVELIERWRTVEKNGLSLQEIAFVRDSYDDCVADLDEQLGRLIDELERRGTLEETWLFITSDHGESFGEQPGIFSHGTSLYLPQLHVPLLVVPPKTRHLAPRVVTDTVSLRDLPSTIVDLLGLEVGAPFPGQSLAPLWRDPASSAGADTRGLGQSTAISEVIPTDPLDPDPTHMLENRAVWASVAEGDSSYIRILMGGTVHEALFDLRTDPHESRNLVEDVAQEPTLQRMRATLDRMTLGPLTLGRFRP